MFVYVLHSNTHDRVYTGMSEDPERRLKEHNSGKTKSTSPYKPWKIICIEKCSNRIEARKREKYLKSGAGREYIRELLKAS